MERRLLIYQMLYLGPNWHQPYSISSPDREALQSNISVADRVMQFIPCLCDGHACLHDDSCDYSTYRRDFC